MIETVLVLFIFLIIGAASFFAAHYVLRLQTTNNEMSAKLEESISTQNNLQERIIYLEQERLVNDNEGRYAPSDGWDTFDIRG